MKKNIFIFLLFLAISPVYSNSHTRIIVTTDIGGSDPDDIQSLVHLMVMLNDVDLEVLFPNTPGFLTDLAQEGLRRLGVDYQCGGQRGYPSCLDCGLVGNEYFGPGSLESKPYPHTKGCRKVCEQAENVWINGSNLTMSTSKPDAVRQYKNLWFTDIWTMIIKSDTFDYHGY